MMLGKPKMGIRINQGFHGANCSIAEKILGALSRGHLAGGDKRGARSTALVVLDEEPYPVVDLRVDDSDTPIEEMHRLSDIYFKEYESVTRRLPTLSNPSGILGKVPKARLRHLASLLEARGEKIPDKWEEQINTQQ